MPVLDNLNRIHDVLSQQAAIQPDAICLYEEGGCTVSYRQLWEHVQTAASWLHARGVKPGHRVMVVGENCTAMIVALFACSVHGSWPVGVNARLSSREIDNIREHAQPEITLYTSGISAPAADHAQANEAMDADASVWGPGLQYVQAGSPTVADTSDVADQVATVIYTSGTTGAPKGVLVPHRGLLHFARISAASRRLTPEDIGYAALPMSHIFGIATVLMASLYGGASLVLRSRFDTEDAFRALANPGVSILQGVPTMFSRLLATAPVTPLQAPALRYVYTGGAALDPTLKRDAQKYFKVSMHHGYGITEYAGSMFITDIDHPREDCSAGYAVEGVELRIGNIDAAACPKPGERGDILIRGPGVMLGYYQNPEQTAQALLPGGWLNTGDIGYLDQSGALHIAGRSKDLIIRSGFNVYPIEVEAVINAFPNVRLSAVVGRELEDKNEEVIAFVEPMPGAFVDTDRLMQHLRKQLAPYKRPARIVLIDTIPTTVSGKILKQPLKEKLA